MRLLVASLFVLPLQAAAESEYVWANPGLEARGVVGEQFQALGKVDLADCEAHGAKAARKAIPISNPPPGFSGSVWRSVDRDRRRDEIAKSRMDTCMADKGWVLQKR